MGFLVNQNVIGFGLTCTCAIFLFIYSQTGPDNCCDCLSKFISSLYPYEYINTIIHTYVHMTSGVYAFETLLKYVQ